MRYRYTTGYGSASIDGVAVTVSRTPLLSVFDPGRLNVIPALFLGLLEDDVGALMGYQRKISLFRAATRNVEERLGSRTRQSFLMPSSSADAVSSSLQIA